MKIIIYVIYLKRIKITITNINQKVNNIEYKNYKKIGNSKFIYNKRKNVNIFNKNKKGSI